MCKQPAFAAAHSLDSYADIDIQLSVYDSEGRVIQTESEFIDSEKFFGFHTFEMQCSVPPKTVAKVRLVPKLS